MNAQRLIETANALVAGDKGPLAMDGLGECISGAILFYETIRQQKKDGTPFVKILSDAGIIPGIKVDTGAKKRARHPGEKITEGLDNRIGVARLDMPEHLAAVALSDVDEPKIGGQE